MAERHPLHRSYLYVPGSEPAKALKALHCGADAVVLDLEDAVAGSEKAAARRAVAAVVAEHAVASPAAVHVRINVSPDGYDGEDLAAVVAPGLDGLRLPKASSPDAVRALHDELGRREAEAGVPAGSVALYPTVESALGVDAVRDVVASSERVVRFAFGASDFLADIGAGAAHEADATLVARSLVVLASRQAGVGPPIDSVHTQLADDEGLRAAATWARDLGFLGKSVIHPRQVPVVHEVFTPSPELLAWARTVVDALARSEQDGRGAILVDGGFVDAAVAARARAVLALPHGSPQP